MRDWTEIYPPKRQRIETSPSRGTYCKECDSYYGHNYDCTKCTKEDIYRLFLRAKKSEKLARERATRWYDQMQVLTGKIFDLKHQIKCLRSQVDRLEAEAKD